MLKEQLQEMCEDAKAEHPVVVYNWMLQKCCEVAKKGKLYMYIRKDTKLSDGMRLTLEDIRDFCQRGGLDVVEMEYNGKIIYRVSWE